MLNTLNALTDTDMLFNKFPSARKYRVEQLNKQIYCNLKIIINENCWQKKFIRKIINTIILQGF